MIPTQDTESWLEWRKNKIGASDCPIIMGVSPWKTPFQLWQEKMGLLENKSSEAMLRGRNLEEPARIAYENLTGLTMFKQTLIHPEHEWMIASFDGLTMDGKRAVEIKCPGKQAHDMAINGVIPEYYIPQLQHQMAVAGLDSIDYFSFDGSTGILLECERDNEYIEMIIQKEIEFYECITKKIPPDLSEKDYLYREDQEWKQLSEKYIQTVSERKKKEVEEAELKQELINLSSNINTKGCGITLTRFMRKGRVSYEKIPQLKDVDVEQFRDAPQETWMIRIEN